MQFECNDLTGQGLLPVAGFHWADRNGLGIGLTATSQSGGPDAQGQMHFPYSWYVKLDTVALSPTEQRALRQEFEQGILPQYLMGATILELKAVTSNAEEKLIFLLVPDTRPGLPKWLLGLECNGACFREDAEPMMFQGEPNG